MVVVEQYNPERIAKEVEKKELGELGEIIDQTSNTELMNFIVDSGVCNALAKWILNKRNIDTNTGAFGND